MHQRSRWCEIYMHVFVQWMNHRRCSVHNEVSTYSADPDETSNVMRS
jgi:hypothetical protein